MSAAVIFPASPELTVAAAGHFNGSLDDRPQLGGLEPLNAEVRKAVGFAAVPNDRLTIGSPEPHGYDIAHRWLDGILGLDQCAAEQKINDKGLLHCLVATTSAPDRLDIPPDLRSVFSERAPRKKPIETDRGHHTVVIGTDESDLRLRSDFRAQ